MKLTEEQKQELEYSFANNCTTLNKHGQVVIKGTPRDIFDYWLSKIEAMEGELPSEKAINSLIKTYPNDRNTVFVGPSTKDALDKAAKRFINRLKK